MSLSDELRTRRPAYVPTDAETTRLDAFFTEHPTVDRVYLFFDGRIIPCADYQKQMTSRTAQLVAIATDGFPVIASRHTYRNR